MRISTLVTAAFVAVTVMSLTPAAMPAPAAADDRTGAIVVAFKPGTTLGEVAEAIDDAGSHAERSSQPSRLVLVEPEPGQSVEDAVRALDANAGVEFAAPERTVSLARTPADQYYASNQWPAPQIGLPAAWDVTTGSSSTIVAVIDTGVQLNHPDLDAKITTGANAGYDFANNDADPSDDHGHGTFVAGIIAAESNTSGAGSGIAGVCWACRIMPVKVLGANGSGSTFSVAAGIDWARTHGAKVINLSLGASNADPTLQAAVDNAFNAGVVVVAASGNSGGAVLYPAAFPNAIAVGANNSSGARSSFSSYGPELDVMAPGESVFSTSIGATYGWGSGTSFAAPHVAGVAGLMMSAGITAPADIAARLAATATDIGSAGFDNLTGWGRVDAARAIAREYAATWGTLDIATTAAPNAALPATVTVSNSGTSAWPSSGADAVNIVKRWRSGGCSGAATDAGSTAPPSDVAPGASATVSLALAAPATTGTWCLELDLSRSGTMFSSLGSPVKTAIVQVSAPASLDVTWDSANVLPSAMKQNATTAVQVTFTNSGTAAWKSADAGRMMFTYHWRKGRCPGSGYAVREGIRTPLPADVAAGETVAALAANVQAPSRTGTYCLQYDLTLDNGTWLSTLGSPVQQQTVYVSKASRARTTRR